MHHRFLTVLATSMLLVSCSGGGGGESAGTDSTTRATTTSIAAPTTTVAPTTTLPPAPVLPAGAQLPADEDAVVLPPGGVYAEHSGTLLAFGSRDNGVKQCPTGTATGDACDREQSDPWVSIGSLGGTFADVQVDSAGSFPAVSGFGVLTWLAVSDATYGGNGWIAVGNASFWDSLLFHNTTRRAAIWQSADGTAWQRIDVRDIVGDTSVLLTGVEATPTGYVAIGEIAQPDLFDGPSRGLVLTSSDGLTWTKAAELPRQWSVATGRVLVGNQRIVVTGVEYVCDPNAGAMNSFSMGAQFRAWASDDGGTSFQEVALAGNGAVEDPLPPPTDPATCPDMYSEDANYRSSAGAVTLDGDRLLLVSSDGATIAATDDLATWATVTVPHALAEFGGSSSDEPLPGVVEGLYRVDAGLVLLEFQLLRRADGTQVSYGSQMYAWRSIDDGATWVLQPLTEPTTLTAGSLGALLVLSDGRRAFLGLRGADMVLRYVEAGDLQPWGTCDPAPNATCRFVDIDALSAAGADLAGIDLAGATLTNADLAGADLSGAALANAHISTVSGADWSTTVLARADLTGARLDGMNLAGANLSGAILTGATVPGSVVMAALDGAVLENATLRFDTGGQFAAGSLAGKSLVNVNFYGDSGGPAALQGVDFTGATLKNTTFSDVNLTGSNLAAAIFDPDYSVTFLGGVICPDGAPPTEGVYDRESCRV